MAYDTLEQAQERILELEELNQNLTTERDSLSQDINSLREENERVRTLNQKYFNKLIAQDETNGTNKQKEEPEKSCEDFAKELAGKI